MIRAVAFDLDNTLYDHALFVRGAHADVAAVAAAVAGVDPDLFFARIHGDWQRLTSRANTIFADALRDFGVAIPGLEDRLVAAYREHRPTLELYPGVRAGLIRLRQAGLPLGLLTDGQVAVQTRKLAALGLTGFFDPLLITGALGVAFYKPHPAGFQRLIELLGTPPASVLYVGDNPLVDFAPAKALGMGTIRVRIAEYRNQTSSAASVDHEFATPDQAIEWILQNREGDLAP